MTEGEFRVGVSFNSSDDPDVDIIKEKTAYLIDLIAGCGKDNRCTSLAMNGFEEAAMWAIKSITKKTENVD